MSELIQKNDNRATIRRKLLTGASALALTAYVASSALAKAEDADRPTIWIELGGQLEMQQGLDRPFVADFMSITPTPDVYKGFPFIADQRIPRFSLGEEGKISFQPEDSNWIFSAGIRYGRSHANRHTHNQGPQHSPIPFTVLGSSFTKYPSTLPLADTNTHNSQRHVLLDFEAGKDVGLGLFGHRGSSTISAGVRFASFAANSSAYITGRPNIDIVNVPVFYSKYHIPKPTFYQYAMSAHAKRSFKGVGPTISWDASAPLVGNEENGEITLDWGINGALLFGRQKAVAQQSTAGHHRFVTGGPYYTYIPLSFPPHGGARSRNVTVPNIGGYAGLSVKYTDVKVSIGYRYDTFLNAMDTGIDAAKKSNLTFNGPYASISIGLGD